MKPDFRRLPASLQSRSMISVSVLLVFLMVITVFAVDQRLARVLIANYHDKAGTIAHIFGAGTASAVVTGDAVALQAAAEHGVSEEGLTYLFVFDDHGHLLAEARRADLARTDLDGDLLRHARNPTASCQENELVSAHGTLRALDASHPVVANGRSVGSVVVGLDLASLDEPIARMRAVLTVIGVCGIVLGLVGARIISRSITASLDTLVEGTIAVSHGDLKHRIEIDSRDEIATLADHFNAMTARLETHQEDIASAKAELEMLNTTLEEKVSVRTRELLASEEKYRVLIESLPDPIVISQDGVIRFANPAFEKTFGYPAASRLRNEVQLIDLFHPEDRSAASLYLDRVLEGESVEVGEIRGVTSGGATLALELRGLSIRYLGAPAIELLLVDSTERKELQDHLVQHEKMRALGELASGVAHDFNNTLGIILGRAQLLQKRTADDEIVRGLRTIERAASDGGSTVRRIQEFARARTERDFDDIDLNQLLEEIVEITRIRWKDQAELRSVKIDVTLDLGEVGNVRGDAAELREVYTNLIFNSVDAMPEGGVISIRSCTDGGEAIVRLSDTGRGMNEHVRSRIFDPFFTTKGPNGMGLGMSVVYGIVERHGGKITVESSPGSGTCFTIRLPETELRGARKPPEEVPPAPKPARVLVVDDEDEILELLSDILEASGMEAETAKTGFEALEKFEPGRFDVLFCDLGMREMPGWEVVRAVRERDPDIGVMLITGWGSTLPEEKIASQGIDAVVNKPFEMERLLSTVQRVLEDRSRPAGTESA